jgi:hypothetical protein
MRLFPQGMSHGSQESLHHLALILVDTFNEITVLDAATAATPPPLDRPKRPINGWALRRKVMVPDVLIGGVDWFQPGCIPA